MTLQSISSMPVMCMDLSKSMMDRWPPSMGMMIFGSFRSRCAVPCWCMKSMALNSCLATDHRCARFFRHVIQLPAMGKNITLLAKCQPPSSPPSQTWDIFPGNHPWYLTPQQGVDTAICIFSVTITENCWSISEAATQGALIPCPRTKEQGSRVDETSEYKGVFQWGICPNVCAFWKDWYCVKEWHKQKF